MKMLVFLFVAIGLMAVPVFAQANATANETGNQTEINATDIVVNEDEVGALPGDFSYGFKRFFENVDKFFTFDKSEKAKKHARYGKIRAIEAHILSGKAQKYAATGDEEAAQLALQYVEQLTAEQNQETEDAQNELEAAVEEGSADDADVEEVQSQIRNSIMVLQRVYEKVPESAKDGVLRALNNSIENQERHMERLEQREERKLAKGQGDDDEEEVTANETEAEDQTNETEEGKGKGKQEKVQKGQDDDEDEEEVEEEEEEPEDEDEEETEEE